MDNSSRLMFAVVMVIAYMAMRGQTLNVTNTANATATGPNTTTALNFTNTANATATGPNTTTALNFTNTANTTTTGPNTTTTLTTVAPIVNTTVTTLTGNISRAECGKTQLCAAVPDNCDPSVAGSCFFVSTKLSSGQTFSFQLRGVSSGYIAVGLSTNSTQGGNDTTYVCANNNSIVQFFTALLDNKSLTVINTLPVDSVKGSVNDQIIQCTFNATVPNATVTTSTRGSATTFFLSISNGTFTNGILGSPTAVLVSNKAVDLSDPKTNVNNITTTAAPSTTARPSTTAAPSSHAFVLQHTLSQALLILLGVLGMMML